jgi:hypothetical protein
MPKHMPAQTAKDTDNLEGPFGKKNLLWWCLTHLYTQSMIAWLQKAVSCIHGNLQTNGAQDTVGSALRRVLTLFHHLYSTSPFAQATLG